MRKLFPRIVIGFVTFVVGISFVFVTSKFSASDSETVFIVKPVYESEIKNLRLIPAARACKPGYVQGYETDDGKFVSEGIAVEDSPKKVRREIREWIRDSRQIIERLPKFRNHRGKVGERIIILNKPNAQGNEPVSIVFYDGGDFYRFINAPTLELALEFEQYLISIDFRAPM
jgi:hypothetical protein